MRSADSVLGASRESTIRRDREGRWFHDGALVSHAGIARAFDRWVARADDGRYCLLNAVDWVYVAIEGAPIFVRSLEPAEEGVVLTLSDGRREDFVPDTLRQAPDGVLYCDVRGGTMPAQFTRLAQLQLEPWISEDERGVFIQVGGCRARPPVVDDPCRPGTEGDVGPHSPT